MISKERDINGKNSGELKESLIQNSIEVRFADLEKDIGQVADLFSQESTIEHLAGIAPKETPSDVNVKKFGIKNPNFGIVIATEEEMRKFYADRPSLKLMVATDKNSKVVGTVTVVPPSTGLTFADIARMVVSDRARTEGIGRKLLKSANAYIFGKPKDGGLGCTASQAGVIKIAGYEKALNLFSSEGYRQIADAKDNCVSWSNETKLFVPRSVILVRLEAESRDLKIDPADFPNNPQI